MAMNGRTQGHERSNSAGKNDGSSAAAARDMKSIREELARKRIEAENYRRGVQTKKEEVGGRREEEEGSGGSDEDEELLLVKETGTLYKAEAKFIDDITSSCPAQVENRTIQTVDALIHEQNKKEENLRLQQGNNNNNNNGKNGNNIQRKPIVLIKPAPPPRIPSWTPAPKQNSPKVEVEKSNHSNPNPVFINQGNNNNNNSNSNNIRLVIAIDDNNGKDEEKQASGLKSLLFKKGQNIIVTEEDVTQGKMKGFYNKLENEGWFASFFVRQVSEIVRMGFLVKQGAKIKNWKSRWFQLTKESLTYRVAPGDKNILTEIDLKKVLQVEKYEEEGSQVKFKIVTMDRVWLIECQTSSGRDEWVTDIARQLKATHSSGLNAMQSSTQSKAATKSLTRGQSQIIGRRYVEGRNEK